MRTARIIRPGVFYHVTARVTHKEMLLRSPVAKDLFLEQLVRLRLRHDCEILDFLVMENHVHLILRPMGKSGLSGVMKFLLGVYTMGYNRIYGTWGRFWGARYFSRPINGLGDLTATMAYVDNNPVRAFLVDSPLSFLGNPIGLPSTSFISGELSFSDFLWRYGKKTAISGFC